MLARKALVFIRQNPESTMIAILWVGTLVLGYLFIRPTNGILNGLLTLTAIGTTVVGVGLLSKRESDRAYRIRCMVNELVEGGCPCRPLFDCPEKRSCLCVCHTMIEAEG